MNHCYINSVYRATEGEGIFVGRVQIFVRFQGCNVKCINCDSKDTWMATDNYLSSVENDLPNNPVHIAHDTFLHLIVYYHQYT